MKSITSLFTSFISLLFLLFVATNFTACTSNKVKTKLAEKVSHTASKVIVAELQCANADVVHEDVLEKMHKLFKVEEMLKVEAESMATSPVVMGMVALDSSPSLDSKVLVCRTITGALLPIVLDLAKAGKLSTWGCTVEKGETVLMELVYQGCDRLAKRT